MFRFPGFAALSLGLSLIITLPAVACPVGDYSVTGWNPGTATDASPSYTGVARIDRNGVTCNIHWQVGDQRFGGVGFFDATRGELAVGYADLDAGWFGQVSYAVDGKRLIGVWAVYGDSNGQAGREILEPR